MHNRLLNQLAVLSLSLSLGVFVSISVAQAEPGETKPSAQNEASSQTVDAATQVPTQLTIRRLTLADGERPDSSAPARKLPNRPLALTSATLFATGYLPAFVIAMANSKETSGNLYVPVVGPWIEMSKNTSPGNRALLTFSGLFQGLGLTGVITSFFVPESRTENWPLLGKRRVTVSPAASRGTYLLGAHGTF